MSNLDSNLINAKYHLAVAKRLHENYYNFKEKRFLVGVINESAKAVSNLIRGFLVFEKKDGKSSAKNLKIFMGRVAPKYLDKITIDNLKKVLEIEKAWRVSPIEFSKKDKIILLIEGKYWILAAGRFEEFLESIESAILELSKISDKYKKGFD